MEGLLSGKENKGEQFKARLVEILDRKITVENIDGYVDLAVEDLIKLTEEITGDYKVEHLHEQSIGKELEDKAYEQNKLPNIGDFLDVAQEKLEELDEIDDYIKKKVKKIKDVFVPPNGVGLPESQGKKKYEVPDIKHRLKSLLYILKENGINLDNINIAEGVLSENMMRGQSYVSVVIPELDRLVFVCDEEGNASYVFDLAKLEETGFSVIEINKMDKYKLSKLITNNPKVGVRFAYSQNWINRAEDFLFNDLPENLNNVVEQQDGGEKEKLPKVSNKELDLWKGFWADPETGKHWGTAGTFDRKLGVKPDIMARIVDGDTFSSIRIMDIQGRERSAYCYEDLIESENVKDILNSPSVEKLGNWKGFYIDESGKHWGTLTALVDKLNIKKDALAGLLSNISVLSRKVKNRVGAVGIAFCYEDIIANQVVQDYLKAVDVEGVGEWRGFYIDKVSGKHWGVLQSLHFKIGVDREVIGSAIKDSAMEAVDVRDVRGSEGKAYCYEDLIENVHIKELLETPTVSREGERKGCYIDEKEKIWATAWFLKKNINKSHNFMYEFFKKNKINFIQVRDLMGKISKAYDFEEIDKILKDKKSK